MAAQQPVFGGDEGLDEIDRSASTRVRPDAAAVGQQVFVVAAGIEKGVGQEGQPTPGLLGVAAIRDAAPTSAWPRA